jgi:ligand-binding SRPBCC domain-containing protein
MMTFCNICSRYKVNLKPPRNQVWAFHAEKQSKWVLTMPVLKPSELRVELKRICRIRI